MNSNVGSWGDASHSATLTINGKGLVTAASNTLIVSASCANPCVIGTSEVQQVSGVPATTLPIGTISMRTDVPRAYLSLQPTATVTAVVSGQHAAVLSGTISLPSAPTPGNYMIATCYDLAALPTTNSGWSDPASGGSVTPAVSASTNAPYGKVVYRLVVTGDTASQTPCTGGSSYTSTTITEVSGMDPIFANSIQSIAWNQANVAFGVSDPAVATVNGTTTAADSLGIVSAEVAGGYNGGNVGNPITFSGSYTSASTATSGANSDPTNATASEQFPSNSSTANVTATGPGNIRARGITVALIIVQPPSSTRTGPVPIITQTRGTTATAGQVAVFSSDTMAGPQTISGDCTASATLAFTCTKLNSVSPGTFFSANAATPPAIGGTTPAALSGTTITATTHVVDQSLAGSGDRCVHASTTGQLGVTSTDCGSSGGGGLTSLVAGAGITGGTITSTGTITAANSQPQGRLTLVSATPVMTSDQTAKGTIYYAEYVGNSFPVYDGTVTAPITFSNLSEILDSTNQPANQVFDVFGYSASGTATLGVGPAWTTAATITVTIATPAVVTWTGHALPEGAPVIFTTSGALPTGITAGTIYYVGKSPAANTFNISTTVANAAAGTYVATSGSQSGTHTGTNHTIVRGTGAGTTELEIKNGVWANKNSITLYNNAVSSGSIAADKATYLGSFYTTAAAQTGAAFSPTSAAGGSSPVLALYNAYNRVRVFGRSTNSDSSWTYSSTTVWRAADNNVASRVSYLDGLAQSFVFGFRNNLTAGGAGLCGNVGMQIDATNVGPTTYGEMLNNGTNLMITASDKWQPRLGFHYVQAIERSCNSTPTFYSNGTDPGRESLSIDLEMIIAPANDDEDPMAKKRRRMGGAW